jgi:hypothetical protein
MTERKVRGDKTLAEAGVTRREAVERAIERAKSHSGTWEPRRIEDDCERTSLYGADPEDVLRALLGTPPLDHDG